MTITIDVQEDITTIKLRRGEPSNDIVMAVGQIAAQGGGIYWSFQGSPIISDDARYAIHRLSVAVDAKPIELQDIPALQAQGAYL